jgi:glycosyltransferase involved in cell wall biosynthesis
VAALADAIERLLEDRQFVRDLAAAAQARARLFDWQEIATQLLGYYEELGAG